MILSDYVKKRNGVPLGANNSLKNMMTRSLGAGNFSTFWKYWNPIWSYYLGKYIFKPLKTILPPALSLIITFTFCGLLHDLAIMIIRRNFSLLFTPWFLIMGSCVIISDFSKIDYSRYAWIIRAIINIVIIGCSYILALQIKI